MISLKKSHLTLRELWDVGKYLKRFRLKLCFLSKTRVVALSQASQFSITHMSEYRLRMRMGVHSGEVIGSVVGSKMPHFSVFGDTVSLFSKFQFKP